MGQSLITIEDKKRGEKMKKALLTITLILLFVLLVSCGKEQVKDMEKKETVEVTWWISRGEDSTYYMSYDDNPAVKYLETLDFNGKKVWPLWLKTRILKGNFRLPNME